MLKLSYSYDVPVLRYGCLNISLNFVLKLVTRSLTHMRMFYRNSINRITLLPFYLSRIHGLNVLPQELGESEEHDDDVDTV